MSIEVIEISSSDEVSEEEYEEKVKTKIMANRSTWGASSGASIIRRAEEPWDEDEEEEYEYEEDEEEDDDDDDDDCIILPYNPFLGDRLDFSRRLTLDSPPLSDDVAIIAERGKVACRDYPHSRHLCGNYPFSKTPHKSHCQKCYCYVCDEPAPCDRWEEHCEASDKDSSWSEMRRNHRAAQQKVKTES
ncbi:RPM1 interacting protein 13-like [Curcuma longa]|uniref:RPM1 interacting protein 13-like n=1 Tax=Curcuma longa TaxID=136217 RepID=UPI003D9FA2D3